MDIFLEDKKLNISAAYLRPGFAFGGSCLTKDVRAIGYLCRKLDLSLPVLNHVLDSNRMLIERGVDWILGQSKKRIAFLGISFKSGTDDVRESPFVEMVERLVGKGRAIRIFDPNVQLDRLLGTNKEYLVRELPQSRSDGRTSSTRSVGLKRSWLRRPIRPTQRRSPLLVLTR